VAEYLKVAEFQIVLRHHGFIKISLNVAMESLEISFSTFTSTITKPQYRRNDMELLWGVTYQYLVDTYHPVAFSKFNSEYT